MKPSRSLLQTQHFSTWSNKPCLNLFIACMLVTQLGVDSCWFWTLTKAKIPYYAVVVCCRHKGTLLVSSDSPSAPPSAAFSVGRPVPFAVMTNSLVFLELAPQTRLGLSQILQLSSQVLRRRSYKVQTARAKPPPPNKHLEPTTLAPTA